MLAYLRLGTTILAIGAMLASGGCDGESSGSQVQPSAARASSAQAEPSAEPGYTVDVELPPHTTRGQEAIARVRIQPKAPWHMNLQYPAKLKLAAPDQVTLDTEILRKADAERFDDQALVFSVLFTPEAKGPHTIEAEVDFAVCGDAACGPVTEAVQLAFDVGCRAEDTGLC